MFLPVPPTQPPSEILKLESYLDKLDKVFLVNPDDVTDKSPIGIDHFKLLDELLLYENDGEPKNDEAREAITLLIRHYVNGLRQFCAGERDKMAMSNVMEKQSAALKETTSKD